MGRATVLGLKILAVTLGWLALSVVGVSLFFAAVTGGRLVVFDEYVHKPTVVAMADHVTFTSEELEPFSDRGLVFGARVRARAGTRRGEIRMFVASTNEGDSILLRSAVLSSGSRTHKNMIQRLIEMPTKARRSKGYYSGDSVLFRFKNHEMDQLFEREEPVLLTVFFSPRDSSEVRRMTFELTKQKRWELMFPT